MSPNNSNRPVMRLTYKLEENPVLKAAITAYKVRAYLARNGRK